MFHRSTLWKGYPGWGSGVSPDPSSLIMARGMTTLRWDIFYSELAHSSEACVLLPTFPAGQIGKNEAEEPGSLCGLLTIPCGVVLTEKHAYKVPPNSISHSEHERRLRLQSWFLWCSVQAPTISHHCSPGLGQWPLCLLAGSFPMHPSHFSWKLLLPNKSDCFPSRVFQGHQAKCHTDAKLFITDARPQPYSHHTLYHHDIYFMESKTPFTVRHDIILQAPKKNKRPIKLL